MLSVNEVFKDLQENPEPFIKRNLKSSSTSSKNLGLKNATNSNYRSTSDSGYEGKKNHSRIFKKSETKDDPKPKTKTIDLADEKWPEIENMHVYKESEDDYEDILPKSERIQKAEIDCFFRLCSFGRIVEPTEDELPTFQEDPIENWSEDFSVTPHFDLEILYDNSPLADIPVPDFEF